MTGNGQGGTLSRVAYGFRLAGVESNYLQRGRDEGRPLLTVRRTVSEPGNRHRPPRNHLHHAFLGKLLQSFPNRGAADA